MLMKSKGRISHWETTTCSTFPGGAVVQNPSASARDVRDVGWIPELERSSGGEQPTPIFLPGEFHG